MAMVDKAQPVALNKVNGAYLLANALHNEGIEVVFASAYADIKSVREACLRAGISILDVPNDLFASRAADAYFRITQKTGCALVGATANQLDAIIGVAAALQRGSAVLLIGLSVATIDNIFPRYEYLLRPAAKSSSTVNESALIADVVSQALRECFNGAPGPSYVEIPLQIIDGAADLEEVHTSKSGKRRASAKNPGNINDIEAFAVSVINSTRPVIIFGSQLWDCRAVEIASEFCRGLNIPAILLGSARGAFSQDSDYLFNHSRSYALERGDLVIECGISLEDRVEAPRGIVDVQINTDYRSVGDHSGLGVSIAADISDVLRTAIEMIGRAEDDFSIERKPWLEELRGVESNSAISPVGLTGSGRNGLVPSWIGRELSDFAGENTLFIEDLAPGRCSYVDTVVPRVPGSWFSTGPKIAADGGIPFGVAAKLADRQREIVCLLDNRSPLATGFDLGFCVQNELPLICVVLSAPPLQTRLSKSHPTPLNGYHSICWTELARLCGVDAEESRNSEEFLRALVRARSSGRCTLIHIPLNVQR